MSDDFNTELRPLNRSGNSKRTGNSTNGWNNYLLFCTLTVSLATFQFGFNISDVNGLSPILKEFIKKEFFLFKKLYEKSEEFRIGESWWNGNKTKLEQVQLDYESRKAKYLECKVPFFGNETCVQIMDKERANRLAEIQEKEMKNNNTKVDSLDQYLFEILPKRLEEGKKKLEFYRGLLNEGRIKVDRVTNYLWTVLNCLFVIGGMFGALISRFLMERFGRKQSILFHYLFGILGALLTIIAPYLKSPGCLLFSRLFYGIQGGMSCSMVPTYLAEVSPAALRGQTGVINQLLITFGILFGQLLCFKEILGNESTWNFLLAIPGILAIFAGLALLFFFPDTPRNLLIKNRDEPSAVLALRLLRNSQDVEAEIEEIKNEGGIYGNEKPFTIIDVLCRHKSLRWPLITSITIHLAQQLSGINAIFFYSHQIFKNAQLTDDLIQYAILSTGLVNVLATFISIPLIEKLGRRPLIIYPVAIMIINFVCLVLLLNFKENSPYYSYLSIGCIIVFVICYAIGLGPIPFIYTSECFRQSARSAGMSICVFLNWSAALLLTLTFEYLQKLIQHYVFIVFIGVLIFSLSILVPKMQETKGKTIEQISAKFEGSRKLKNRF